MTEEEDGSGAVPEPSLRAHVAQQFGQEAAIEKARRKAQEAGGRSASSFPKVSPRGAVEPS